MRTYLKSTAAFGMALSMLAAPAFAQPDKHDDGHDNGQHTMAPQHSQMQYAPQQHQVMQQQQPMQHEPQQHQPQQHQYVQHEQVQPQHQQMASSRHWRHGQHYDGSRRVVGNWQHYHLRQPPHGYEWVQDGSQFVLIAVASGIIADVLLNAAYH
jgi:Ni/Co efflux regulator RcnB